jgi:hypothetical protein
MIIILTENFMEDLMDLKQKQNWINCLELYRKSGLSKKAFCKTHKIPEGRFYYFAKLHGEPSAKTLIVPRPAPKQSFFIPLVSKKEFKIKINESVSLSFDTAPDASWMASFIKSYGEYHVAV